MTIAEPILDFSRYEFKYVLQRTLRESFEAELQYFMELDPFVRDAEGHCYAVRSLYYEDPQHTAFYDKIDGLRDRYKFRLRTYCRQPETATPVFIEKKGRCNNRVFKHRLALGSSMIFPVGAETGELPIPDPANPVAESFVFDRFRKEISPLALIDYYRRPYISRYDHEFRVTFDEDLRAIETDRLFPGPAVCQRRLLIGYTVMEVKFDRTVPAWFHRLIQSYELRRYPLSKICEGMVALDMTIDLQ